MTDALPHVFISYARTDSTAFVDRLEHDLKDQHFLPWVDRHTLQGGQEWLEMIQDAIDQCQSLVVVLSPEAVQSQYVRMEYRYATSLGKLVIPVKYLSITRTPIDLNILQWVDFQASYEDGLHQLVQALSHLKMSDAPPAPAQEKLPKTKGQWLEEANGYFAAKRYEEALEAYKQVIRLDPGDAYVYYFKSMVLERLGRKQEAEAARQQARSYGLKII